MLGKEIVRRVPIDRLTHREFEDIHATLKKYNKKPVQNGMDIRFLPPSGDAAEYPEGWYAPL